MRLTSSDFNDRSWFATVKTRSLIFVILLFTAYIGICSKYAYSYYDRNLSYEDPWSADTPTNIEQNYELAGRAARAAAKAIEAAAERARTAEGAAKRAAEDAFIKRQLVRLNVPSDRVDVDTVPGRAVVTAKAIKIIGEFVGGDVVRLTGILDKIGYSPPAAAAEAFRRFPVERKLAIAYGAAEKAHRGSGDDVLVGVVHGLAEVYESVQYHPVLNRLIAISPKSSIDFAAVDPLSSFSIPHSRRFAETINAIATYCNSGVLGGVHEILVNHLYLKNDIAFDIVTSSQSDSEALARGLSNLEPQVAGERLNIIIKLIQDNYPSAREIDVFNECRSLSPMEYRTSEELQEFHSGVIERIDQETGGDAPPTSRGRIGIYLSRPFPTLKVHPEGTAE